MRQLKTDVEKIFFCREAAAVTRCHVVQKIGHYDNGQHTFNMLTMLRILYPEASTNLIWAIVGHDIPERWTGDIPAPVKWASRDIATVLTELEDRVYQAIGWNQPVLTSLEQSWLKGLDLLELLIWAKKQALMGNTDAVAMIPRIRSYMDKISTHLPAKVILLVPDIMAISIDDISVGELD